MISWDKICVTVRAGSFTMINSFFMKTKCKGEPTLILFQSGSYTFMGCKSINQVKEYRMFIINLLNHFVK